MAIRLEKGGKILLVLIGLGLIYYALARYGVIGNLKEKISPGAKPSAPPVFDTSNPLPVAETEGKKSEKVRVRVNIWVGCVPGLVANGGLDTAPGSIYADKGLDVSFKIIDDWTDGAAALATKNVDIMLTTVDVYAKDYYQFMQKNFGTHAILMVDWSRGADGVIGKEGINSIEDLAGKTVAYAPYTPSHFLLWNGLKGSGLSTEERSGILNKAVHTKDGIEPATMFAQQKVDAAVSWDPDMSDAVSKRPGSKKVYDTRIASKLIADILIVSDTFAAEYPQTLVKFIDGWLQGVEFINQQPNRAYTLIGTIKDFNIPADLAKIMLEGVRLSDYNENRLFFGINTGKSFAQSDYSNIFGMAQEMYRELRIIKKSASPADTVDTRYLVALASKYPGELVVEKPEYKPPAKSAAPIATQHRSIYFQVDSAEMSPDSRSVVDEVGNFMKAYENTVVDVEGNTDSTGSRSHNIDLSRRRAETVKHYLTEKYGFPESRMRTFGNGPDKPITSNATPEGRERNRRTDIKVYPNP